MMQAQRSGFTINPSSGVGAGPRACPAPGRPQGVAPTQVPSPLAGAGPRACPAPGRPQGVAPTQVPSPLAGAGQDGGVFAAVRDPQIAAVFKRPFDEQVAFFRGKLGNLVPTQTWRDVQGAAHDRAFMVAGASTADLLADLAGAVDKAVTDGETLQAFRARFGEIVKRNGWHGWTGEGTKAGEAWRTRVIYQTNLSTSYAAGRLAQLKDGEYPLWIYRHSDASLVPRPEHLAWDGVTLPPDDPFWKTHYGPNGWGCKCTVEGARSASQAKRFGGDPDKQPPKGWDQRDATGRLPGIDEGWDYQPGATSGLLPQPADDLAAVRASGTTPIPLPAPRSAPASRLLPTGESPDFYVRAFLDEFGVAPGEMSLFADVAGDYLAISDALFRERTGAWKATKRGRGPAVLLLADTIRSPDEIRMAFDPEAKRLRRRYIARWVIEGEDLPALVVFEWSLDRWSGVTAMVADDVQYLERRGRLGEVVWKREPNE